LIGGGSWSESWRRTSSSQTGRRSEAGRKRRQRGKWGGVGEERRA